MSTEISSPETLPSDSTIEHVRFLTPETPGVGKSVQGESPHGPGNHRVLHHLRTPFNVTAVSIQTEAKGPDDLSILTIPEHENRDEENYVKAKYWVQAINDSPMEEPHIILLQGVKIIWGCHRMAIIAPEAHLQPIMLTLIEIVYYEAELTSIEKSMAEGWQYLDKDASEALEFGERNIHQHPHLKEQYQKAYKLRARLAKITPFIAAPFAFPPTLSSQISERVRERTRMMHRAEHASDQLEVFEEVYEMCSSRVNEYLLTRSNNKLEWIIIILLVVQIVLSLIDLLAGSVSTPTTTISSETQVSILRFIQSVGA